MDLPSRTKNAVPSPGARILSFIGRVLLAVSIPLIAFMCFTWAFYFYGTVTRHVVSLFWWPLYGA
jgi:hypothetical protein